MRHRLARLGGRDRGQGDGWLPLRVTRPVPPKITPSSDPQQPQH